MNSLHGVPENKQDEHERIQQEVEEFLAKGGKIQVAPSSVPEPDSDRKSLAKEKAIKNGISKRQLTMAQAREIRNLYLTSYATKQELADTFKVHPSVIRSILQHRSYKES